MANLKVLILSLAECPFQSLNYGLLLLNDVVFLIQLSHCLIHVLLHLPDQLPIHLQLRNLVLILQNL